jgi:hypothetical protein
MNLLTQLKNHLYELEAELQQQDARKNPSRLAALISDDFIEISASGKKWTKQDAIEALHSEHFTVRNISDFNVRLLGQNVALVTYHCHRHAVDNVAAADSLRSSVWIHSNGQWRLVFHQGTGLRKK